jgi:hypothetical protein
MLLSEEPDVQDDLGSMSNRGFTLGLAGVAIYLVGTFLPSMSGNVGGPNSEVTLMLGWGSHPSLPARFIFTGLVFLYGAMLVVAVACVAGLRSAQKPRWGAALLAASSIWFLPTLSRVVRLLDVRFPDGIGSWLMYLGTAVALAGGILAVIDMRRSRGSELRTSLTAVLGFVLGVLGVGLYVFSTTLVYETTHITGLGPSAPSVISHSLYSELLHQPMIVPRVAQAITVYGAAGIMGAICLAGVLGRRQDLWAAALLAAALAWSPRLVELLYISSSQNGFSSAVQSGFWGVQTVVVVMLAAGVLAVAGTRRLGLTSPRTSSDDVAWSAVS